MSVPIEKFGKDHWSLLAYLECRCVDNNGVVDKRHLRCNSNNHPLQNVNANYTGDISWNPAHGTRLAGYFENKKDSTFLMSAHDDWDCMDDLEDCGLIEILSLANGFVKLTDLGNKVCGDLRAFKSKGGVFADFRYTLPKLSKANS